MIRIVKTEFYKLKRYHILWAGVALMLLSVLLTLFTSMANDGSVWDFAYLTEQVIKNNMSMIFPMCISLIAGYMISREQTDDTLIDCMWCTIYYLRFDMQSVYSYRRNDCRISRFSNILSLKSDITNNRSQFLFISCCSADYYNYLS